jgi:cyclic pyranopterin phosphate synthase
MPQERFPRLDHSEILSYEEILRLIRVGIQLGISKVRITGGEPLVRKGVYPFLDRLNRMDGLRDISLTTNGMLLADNIDRIYQSGIRRINVSIDTLDRDRYRQITGVDGLPRVWRGIQAALEKGFSPIKLNVVALKGINEDELVEMARLSFEYPFHIRFIEQMPIGNSQAAPGKPLLAPVIKQRIGALGQLRKVEKTAHDGPAQRYRLEGAIGEVGFIPAISQHFCERCNRLRLTASGQLRPCLLSDLQEDFKGPLRAGCSDADITEIYLKAVQHKPCDHHLNKDRAEDACSGQMHAIGG